MNIPGFQGTPAWLPRRTIFLTRYGSHAYGLARPESDLDVRGVVLAPREVVLGFSAHFEGFECKDPDVVLFELRRFMHLAAECNPNVLEVLFTDPSDHLGVTPAGERLIAARAGFLSRRARHTYAGFAMAQRKKLAALCKDPAGAKSREAGKAAMHMVRLLRMGREILEGCGVTVKRPDRDALLALRAGDFDPVELDAWAASEDAELARLTAQSPLPERPDLDALDALCVTLMDEGLRNAE